MMSSKGVPLVTTFLLLHASTAFLTPGLICRDSSKPFIKSSTCRKLWSQNNDDDNEFLGRRNFLTSSSAAVLGATLPFAPPNVVQAVDGVDLTSFRDEECGFEVSVPSKWEQSTQSFPYPDRRKIVFFLEPGAGSRDEKGMIFIAYTPIRDDFTQLSSFGSVDQVAQFTILPKGKIMGEETESNMLSAESKKNAYFFDYVVKVPEQPKRHLRTVFSLAPGATGGAGSVLVTLTAQIPEEKYAGMKKVFDDVVESYGKIKPTKS